MTVKRAMGRMCGAALIMAAVTAMASPAVALPGVERPAVTAGSAITKVQAFVGYRSGHRYYGLRPNYPRYGYGYGYGPGYGYYRPYYNSYAYGYRPYYWGYYRPAPPRVVYYETPAYVVRPAAPVYHDDAVARCAARFRSFNVRTGTYVTYDGEERLCPYLR